MTTAVYDEKLAAATAGVRADLPGGDEVDRLSPADLALLSRAAPDALTLKRWLKRRMAGEPLAYIVGQIEFGGESFVIDKRAYITDPEAIHLVTAVAARVNELAAALDRAPFVAEIGVGCGTLGLSVQRRAPAASLVGLDLDPDPLALAAENSRRLRRPLRLIESDLFDSWPPDLPAPDLIFADPPWGDATTLYANDRPAEHYTAMPAASAFPLGGRTGIHAQILRAVKARGWTSEVWMNFGILPRAEVEALAAVAAQAQLLQPLPGITLLRCRLA
jgi:methylase of polypeptide subunit release factors